MIRKHLTWLIARGNLLGLRLNAEIIVLCLELYVKVQNIPCVELHALNHRWYMGRFYVNHSNYIRYVQMMLNSPV